MKRTIRLNESELKRMISESVKRVLRESTHPRRRFGLRENNERDRYNKVYNFCNTEVYWENGGHNLDNPHDFADLVKYIASKTNEDYKFCYDVLCDYVDNNPDVYGDDY